MKFLLYTFYIIPTCILAFMTIFFLPVICLDLYQMLDAKTWPNKEAIISESKLKSIHEYGKDDMRWYAEIYAQYTESKAVFKINSHYYAKKRDWDYFLSELSSHGKFRAQHLIQRYPVGKKVIVYTKPDKPQYSVLEPNSENAYTNMTNLIKTCFVFIANFFFYFLVVRKWLKNQKNTSLSINTID